ncbi:hypothetical protein C8T65DRAFT_164123 [Cerioporus squamosus]|nr:hypothetical protein C8T65DRAFT_164123 [Cerioporus squamosus]
MIEQDSPSTYSPSETWSRTRECVLLVHSYVLEFSRSPSYVPPRAGATSPPALSDLVHALLEWEFLSVHVSTRFSSSVNRNTLLESLTDVRFYTLGPQTTAHRIAMTVLHTLLLVGGNTASHRQAILLPALLNNVYQAWTNERDERRQLMSVSPMPWSTLTLQDGLPSLESGSPSSHTRTAFIDFERPECVTGVRSRISSEFICFPPMCWLGAQHDGHPISPSLSAYVWQRYEPEMTRRAHLALWQSALSFGVLEAVLDGHIPERLLLSDQTDGSIALTCQNLCVLCVELIRVLKSAGGGERAARARRAKDVVTRALLALDEAALPWKNARGIFRSTGLTKDEEAEMICSLATLSNGLYIALHGICREELMARAGAHNELLPGGLPRRSEVSSGVARFVYQRRMIEAGWCPFTVHGLVHDSHALALLAFAFARKPFVRRAQDEHAGCTPARCSIHDIDSSWYTTQHTTPECSCDFIRPTFSGISGLLLDDEIPVLTYEGKSFKISRAVDGGYVAISHVWADGLGSTTEQGLSTCQVVRISTAARELVPIGAFWIDSLCVPSREDLRKKAIHLMAQTYRRAAKVLVFDAGIRTLCSMNQSMDENYLRIMTSTWVQRVWTLQEALLSQELFFEFSDRLVASWELVLPHSHGVVNIFSPVRNDFLMSPGLQLLLHDTSGAWSSARYTFDQVAGLLMRRTTSKPQDETVAVAGLLGVDVARLLDESGQDARMRVFLLQVQTIPAAIVLSHAPVRLPFPGFRWAPRSFSGMEEEFVRAAGMATCAPDGLTTQQEFTIYSFPRVVVSNSETETRSPDCIYLHLSSSGSLYVMPDLRKLTSEGVHEIDAVIIFPSTPETPLVARQPVVVVSTVPDEGRGDDAEDSDLVGPLKCVYRFRAYLGNWSERVRPRDMCPELFDRPPDEVFIEAQRSFRRVMIT